MAEKNENSKLAQSVNKNRWSGGVTDKTQMKFNQVLNDNKKIKEKLSKLRYVGIINESNSLFKQIVADIKHASRHSMTHSEIVNCIKASSIGSVFEPKSFDQPKILQTNPHAKLHVQGINKQ